MNNKESINLTHPSYIVLGFRAYLNLCYVQMQRLANFVVSFNVKLFLLFFFFVEVKPVSFLVFSVKSVNKYEIRLV